MTKRTKTPSRGKSRWPTRKMKKRFTDVFAGEVPTQEELDELVRFLEFQRNHAAGERARKRKKPRRGRTRTRRRLTD
jgi:hypothetical protein